MIVLTKCRYLKPFNFFKNLIRNNSVNVSDSLNTENEEKTKNKTHIYKKAMTRDEVVKFLLDSVVYNKDQIIVTNKPYGVGKVKPKRIIQNFVSQTFNDVYLEEVLPEVAETLGFKSLKVAMAPERYASGVIILASTEEARKKIVKSSMAAEKINKYTYITVAIGQLAKQNLVTKFALKQQKDSSGHPEVLESWSNNDIKSRNFVFVRWKHKVLANSKWASLVQINISNIHWNSLRLYMATKCLTPILGDILFGWRVKNVMGVPLLIDPLSCTPKVPKKLESELLSALQITQNEVPMIPSHVHLQSVTLPIKEGINFFVSVPPPESFVWTCEQLQLTMAKPPLLQQS